MFSNKLIAIAALLFVSGALLGCSDNDKIMGDWISMHDGKPIEFSEKQLKNSDGIQVVDGYQINGDKVTVYTTKNGSKIGTEYTLSEAGKKACTGPELDTCIVRKDRLGKLQGYWSPDGKTLNSPAWIAIYAGAFKSGFGLHRIESAIFDGNKVSFTNHDDVPPRQPVTMTFFGDDVICNPENAVKPESERKCLHRLQKE